MGKLVCNGAMCECEFGSAPATLEVLSNPEHYTNDGEGSEKLTASTMDIANPFKEKTFGTCKKQQYPPLPPPPCVPNITQWQDFYDKVTLKNGGQILLEESQAICSFAGAPCITITQHGQQAEVSQTQADQTSEEEVSIVNPLMNAAPLKTDYQFDAK